MESPKRKSYRYEELSEEVIQSWDPDNLPLLYIDVKISHDEVSRLILYKNQTPYEAATDFIQQHNIPTKLRPYLICKVQGHYEKYIEKNGIFHD